MFDPMHLTALPSRIKSTIFNHVDTVDYQKVAPIFREPFIHSGYRLPDQTWSYYGGSLFQLQNETANVWFHIMATMVVLANIWEYFCTYDILHDKDAWSLIGFSLGCLLGAMLSSIAHHFHSKSIWWHYVLFMMDYGGVTLYTFGTGLGCMYISSQKDMYHTLEPFFLPLNLLVSIFTFNMCCRAKLKSSSHGRRRRILMLSMIFHAAVICVPVIPRYIECVSLPECSLSSLKHLTRCFALILLAIVIYASHVPERFFPGKFDLGGHGHSLFHLVGLWIIHTQMEGVKVDISKGASAHTEPSLRNILTSYAVLISAQILCLLYLRGDIKEKVERDTLIWDNIQSEASE